MTCAGQAIEYGRALMQGLLIRPIAAMIVTATLTACMSGTSTSVLIDERARLLAEAADTAMYMDAQEYELRDLLDASGVSVERVRDDIILRTPGQATFEPDRADINPAFQELLVTLVAILNDYDQTLIEVSGYSDPTGPMVRNMELSLQRAEAVAKLLEELGVSPERISAKGLGPLDPVADNATDEGRVLNRRVELVLRPFGRPKMATAATN